MSEDTSDDAAKGQYVRFGVSNQHFAYLGWLVNNTLLGRSENEVAKHVLAQRLTEMREEDYRDKPPSRNA